VADETRRAIVATGMAGALAAAFVPWTERVTGHGEAPHSGQPSGAAARTVEVPGLFDLQVNGFAGVDFSDAGLSSEQLLKAVDAIGKTGVTRFLPTLITSSLETFSPCARTIARTSHPAIAGIHMEGPYIAREDGPRGAHPREFVRDADVDDFRRRQDAAEGRIRLVTVSPESPGVLKVIEHAAAAGVRVAIGHTGATPAQIADAVSAGATLSTHLGNGCAQVLPRHPNVIWEQLADDRLTASFIVDGHHLPAATVKAMIRAKTPARAILVTDAMAAAGMPPGRYLLGGQEVELSPTGRVAAPGAPNLAGSALRLDAAIGNTVRFTGLPLEDVVAMASSRPADYLGLAAAGRITADWDPSTGTFRTVRVVG
jgi:N-acetylglucosamine-6-phosphate deacetylase